jgi:uncharacterized protein
MNPRRKIMNPNTLLSHPENPQRVHLVDALRGFALMGLFLVHSIELFELYWQNPEDSLVHDVIFFLFAGKAYGIFAMLFGVSFFIIMDRQAQKGVDFRLRFAWRLAILFALGTLNSMVYSGEVLQVLAGYGFFLILAYRIPSKWLILLAILFLLTPHLIYHYWAAMQNLPGANDKPYSWILYEQAAAVWTKGTLPEVLAFNVTTGSLAKWFFFLDGSRGFQLLGLFLIGLVIGRMGFLVKPASFTRLRKHIFVAAIFGAIILFALQKYFGTPEVRTLWPEGSMAKWYLDETIGGYFCLSFIAILVLSFIAFYQKQIGQKTLGVLAPVGRMSLTIYVTQSLCGVPFFYGYGLGMYDKLSQLQALLIGVAFFSVQVMCAHWWLKRFHYGPLEWLWRAATYLTVRVPFVKK